MIESVRRDVEHGGSKQAGTQALAVLKARAVSAFYTGFASEL